MDPLLSWANEAHWSMGGLSLQRLRLQGRIEGNVNKLRLQRERVEKNSPGKDSTADFPSSKSKKRAASVSPPPAPVATKRRRFLALSESEDEEQSDAEVILEKKKAVARRGAARKLGDDFERVAKESVGLRRRNGNGNGIGTNIMMIVQEINDEEEFAVEKKVKKVLINGNGAVQSRSSPRTSPILAKRG